jgi:hypothetical protein
MSALDHPSTSTLTCEYCRGLVPTGEAECLRCGAPLGAASFDPGLLDLPIDDFIIACHEKIVQAGTSAAELAFGVGCTLEVLVAGMLMVIIFFAFTRVWTELTVILLILALISFLISSILSTRAREATMRKTFERDIMPEIDRYLAQHAVTRTVFVDQAAEVLPASSPLLVYAATNRSSN